MSALSDLGAPVRVFASGGEFLTAVRSDDFGCVLLDLELRDLSGIDVIDRLDPSGSARVSQPTDRA
jgi:FixJ family two-component response regulator